MKCQFLIKILKLISPIKIIKIKGKFKQIILKNLALFLNKAMDDGCISHDWGIACIPPIFKKGAGN